MSIEIARAGSPRLQAGAESIRTEAEVRAIRARRRLLEHFYRADGFSESYIAAHVTDDLAAKMLAYDRSVADFVAALFPVRA